MSVRAWHLLTGELAAGGIGDYTRLLADALAAARREVHVWSPDAREAALDHAVRHRMSGVGADALRELGAELDRFRAPRRLLVQYAPQAWGMRGMNLALGRWLRARRRAGDDVRVMFHEPFFPFGWQWPQRNLLALANRWMARDLLRASTRAYVSIRAWEKLLRPLAPAGLPFEVLPIPSTIPCVDDPARVAELRRELSEEGRRPVFVHFGTYGGMIAPMLRTALQAMIGRRPDARVLLLGREGPAFGDRLRASDPRFADAVVAPGYLAPEEVSLHLQASDVAIQPYPDGADTRRTSLMACLANGVPTATTQGRFTDHRIYMSALSFTWIMNTPVALGLRATNLLDDPVPDTGYAHPELRRVLRARYREEFAVERTVERLLADEDGG